MPSGINKYYPCLWTIWYGSCLLRHVSNESIEYLNFSLFLVFFPHLSILSLSILQNFSRVKLGQYTCLVTRNTRAVLFFSGKIYKLKIICLFSFKIICLFSFSSCHKMNRKRRSVWILRQKHIYRLKPLWIKTRDNERAKKQWRNTPAVPFVKLISFCCVCKKRWSNLFERERELMQNWRVILL